MNAEIIHVANHESPDGGQDCAICGETLCPYGELFTPGNAVKEIEGHEYVEIVTGGDPTCFPDGLGGALVKVCYSDGEMGSITPVLWVLVVVALLVLGLLFLP